MTQEAIDWDKPICLDTVPPRPARVVAGPSITGCRRVKAAFLDAEINPEDFPLWVAEDGAVFGGSTLPPVRNVRPGDFEPAEPAPDLAAQLLATQEQAAELAEALRAVADGSAFRAPRYAEDDEAEYHLRRERVAMNYARAALAEYEESRK